MATVVYDGEVGGGSLFAGTKFFFVQRVPERKLWMRLVEANGGENVILDKVADIIVADHARKDCPPGSISWKYIEQSVKQGRLQDIDNYRAGPAEHAVRAAGSIQPTRRHRVPFTDEDDQFLLRWVTKAERSGLSIKGNIIYEQLEQKNPRHTFQSWRDRWVKYVSKYSRPEIGENDDSASPYIQPPRKNGVAAGLPQLATPKAKHKSSIVSSKPSPPDVRPSGSVPKRGFSPIALPGVPFVPKSVGGWKFSGEEIELLDDIYDDVMNLKEDQVIDAWAAWAAVHPNHTAQEWYNCFHETIIPRKKAPKKEARKAKAPASDANEAVFIAPPSSPLAFKFVLSSESAGKKPSMTETLTSQGQLARPDPYMTDEKLFNKELAHLAATLEPPLLIDFSPKICGRPISLFRLWQVVRSDEFGGYMEVNERNLWSPVARRLNFNDFQHSEAQIELKACYEEILADFEGWLLMKDEAEDLTESQENELIGQQLGLIEDENDDEAEGDVEKEAEESEEIGRNYPAEDFREEAEEAEEDDDDDLEAPSSMPRRTSPGKRKFAEDLKSGSRSHQKYAKIDKGKGKAREIPSTPDDVLNISQKPLTSYQPSPLKHSFVEDQDDHADEPFSGPVSKPNFGRGPTSFRRAVEPETQDFQFATQPGGGRLDFLVSPSPDNSREMAAGPSSAPRSGGSNGRHRSSLLSNRGTPASNSKARHQSPPATTSSPLQISSADKVNAFVDRFVSLGWQQNFLAEALGATTMETVDAPFVYQSIKDGNGIPDNMRGVWTAEDDEVVERGETAGKEWLRVLKKHGLRRCNIRREYLRDSKDVEEALRGD